MTRLSKPSYTPSAPSKGPRMIWPYIKRRLMDRTVDAACTPFEGTHGRYSLASSLFIFLSSRHAVMTASLLKGSLGVVNK